MDPIVAYVDITYKGMRASTSTRPTDREIDKAVTLLKERLQG